jgi:glutaryl-CoA dehydrogenase
MNNYKGVDYYNVESLLTPEEIMIRETVREFVSDEVIPIIEKTIGNQISMHWFQNG